MGRRMKRRFGRRGFRRFVERKQAESDPAPVHVAPPYRFVPPPRCDDPPWVRYWRYFPLDER